jgi:hypothetical protein
MIPRSTTLTDSGRRLRSAILWAVAAVVVLVALAFVFDALDRSTVVSGPDGSSHVTTATGLAALHEVLDRDGRRPIRMTRPITQAALDEADAYVVADARLPRYDKAELIALDRFVHEGGTAVVLGVPPPALLDVFEVELDWVGRQVGEVEVDPPLPDAATIDGSRFGAFTRTHEGRRVAGSTDVDLAVAFDRGAGSILFVADSSVAHNGTIDQADNIDFLGGLLIDRTLFDEFRHGYDDTPATGLISAAPGNWTGAFTVGIVVLVLVLASYGRRFGPVEPRDRVLAPDRKEFIDAVARSIRRTGSDPPLEAVKIAVRRELGLTPDAPSEDVTRRIKQEMLPPEVSDALAGEGRESAFVLDRALASLTNRRRT